MSKTRWLASILLIVIVASILIAAFISRRSYRYERSPDISLSDYPKYVTTPTVVLRGHVWPNARIELTRDTSSLGAVDSRDNQFQAEVELEPGTNPIRLSARTYEFEAARTDRTIYITWEPEDPPVPIVNALPPTTNVPTVTIAGSTYPNGGVEVTISPDISQTSNTPPPKSKPGNSKADKVAAQTQAWGNSQVDPIVKSESTGKSGSFEIKVRLPEAGPYKVSAVARNSTGAASPASPDVKFLYDPNWYPPLTPVQAPNSRRIGRKVDLALSHKQMSITLEVKLPRDDPAVTALLSSGTTLDEFFEEIFRLRINNRYYVGEFRDVVPQVVIKGQDATITATSLPHTAVRDFLPVLRGALTIHGSGDFPFSSPDDALSIQTSDYKIESVGPPPTIFEKNTLTWTGSDARRSSDSGNLREDRPFGSEIKLQLAYKPFASPRNFFRLAQVSPYSFWNYPGSAIPQLLRGLCLLIPMLWVLWLVADSPLGNTIDAGLRNDLYRLSKTLITLSLVDTIFDISWGLGYLGWTSRRFKETYWVNYETLPGFASVAIFLLAFLSQLLTSRASKQSWAIWLARISHGTAKAALAALLLVLTGLLYLNQLVIRAAAFTIVAVALSLFFHRTARVLKHGGLTLKHNRPLLLLAILVALSFLVPIATPVSRFDAPWGLTRMFSMLQPLLPYALAIGLLVVLKSVTLIDQRRGRYLVVTIGLILFSAYLVGTTANLFMIPVPFILSIWMFKKFVIHDFRKCGALDFVNKEVVRERRRLIGDVLAYETAQRLQADIQKLTDKVSSGDMTLKDFEDRKSEIEKYAYAKEVASTHLNGLHAKSTVLGIGPNTEDWENGRWCFRWGAALIAPFLIVYLLILLLRPAGFSESVFGFVFGFNQVLAFIADWLLAAFFFGYYFRYLRGNSGLEKGLRTACAVIVCLLPTWVTDISDKTDLIGVFFRAGQTFLFFTLLGMGAFDYATFRTALRDQFRWRTFARFGNMPSFTAVLSVVITSIGVGLTSVLTGQFTELLTNLLSAAFQQAPGPPR